MSMCVRQDIQIRGDCAVFVSFLTIILHQCDFFTGLLCCFKDLVSPLGGSMVKCALQGS